MKIKNKKGALMPDWVDMIIILIGGVFLTLFVLVHVMGSSSDRQEVALDNLDFFKQHNDDVVTKRYNLIKTTQTIDAAPSEPAISEEDQIEYVN